jgi:hypothetical protein
MDQVHVIRHQVLVEGRSQRQVAKELHLTENDRGVFLKKSKTLARPEGLEPARRPDAPKIGLYSRILDGRSVIWSGYILGCANSQSMRIVAGISAFEAIRTKRL